VSTRTRSGPVHMHTIYRKKVFFLLCKNGDVDCGGLERTRRQSSNFGFESPIAAIYGGLNFRGGLPPGIVKCTVGSLLRDGRGDIIQIRGFVPTKKNQVGGNILFICLMVVYLSACLQPFGFPSCFIFHLQYQMYRYKMLNCT
jgi:hypothetical protein